MNIYLIGFKSICKLKLPTRVEGGFFLKDYLSEDNLLLIESSSNGWLMTGANETKIYDSSNNLVERTVLKVNNYYLIEHNGVKNVVFCSKKYDNTTKLYAVKGANITIGRNDGCTIKYVNNYIKENHFSMMFENGKWSITCEKGSYVYVNDGLLGEGTTLINNGDKLFVYGLNLIVMNGFLFINNPDDTVTIDTNILKAVSISEKDVSYVEVKEEDFYKDDDYYFNTPRIRRFIENYELSIANPPSASKEEEMPIMLVIGPMIATVLSSVISTVNAVSKLVSGDGNFMTALPSVVTAVASLLATLLWPNLTKKWTKKQNEKNEKIRKEKYLQYLEEKRKEIIEETINQTNILKENLLPLSEYYEMIINHKRTLWGNKMSQKDFLTVRVGTGDIPIEMSINFNEDDFVIEKDPLKEVANKMVEDAKMIRNVPIGYSFYDKFATAIMGKDSLSKTFTDNLLLQLMALHSYDELKIVIFTNGENKLFWEKYKELPHLFNNDKSFRFYAADDESAKNLSSYLTQEFINRLNQMGEMVEKESDDSAEQSKMSYKPYYLIFTDDYMKIRKLSICDQILSNNDCYGFSFVILDNRLSHLPSKCTNIIMLDSPMSNILRNEVNDYYQLQFNNEMTNQYDMEKCVAALSNIPIEFEQDLRYLPTSLSFLEMYKVGKVEQLNITSRWKGNDPTTSLKAPLGVDDQGNLIMLDLHEKYHGPHGLIAGTTGSGKSEFIITYILSMCVNYSPNEVAFILIDYKGGGLAGAFENKKNNVRLPHLAGTITNLDKNELNRTLVSIQSELKRRQSEFNDARDNLGESTIDIYKYQKFFREGKLEKPMPHLFIICDEFAELKAQQPEFMDNLISAARIGRSLGVHLILATQKPSGVVNDQIWSNTKFRVCLKVADKGDSNEIIKCPDAAEIKNAGRFYLQVGLNEIFVLGQSGWCGANYVPSDEIKKEYDRSVSYINDNGMVIASISDDGNKKKQSANGDQLSNILKYVTYLADKDNTRAQNLWLDNIPADIYLDDLIKKYNFNDEAVTAIIGEYDAPEKQKQGLLTLPMDENANTMIYGLSSSSREMFLREVIFSCSYLYSSELINFYVLDFGSETFRVFDKIPHVGEVLFSYESDKLEKLMKVVGTELEDRKKLFVDYNGEFALYNKNSGSKVPLIVIVINNFESFKETYSNYDDLLIKYSREGKRYGIVFMIATGTTSGLYSRFLKNFDNTFVLDMNSKEEYVDILGRIGNVYPAEFEGRGIVKKEEAYEYQTAKFCDYDNLVEYVKEQTEIIKQKNPVVAKKIPVLPEQVTLDLVQDKIKSLDKIPLGLNKNTIDVEYYNFIKDNATVISFNRMDDSYLILNSLITEFKMLGNVVTILVDYDGICEDFKDKVGSYCKSEFSAFLEQTIKFLNEKINNSKYYASIIFAGTNLFRGDVSDELATKFMDTVAKMPNAFVLIVDEKANLTDMNLKTWYSSNVVNTNGIWVASGVMDQNVIKANKFGKDHELKMNQKYAWLFNSGNSTLIKLLDCEVHDEE